MTSIPENTKAQGGDLWLPRRSGALGSYVNTSQERRNLILCATGTIVLISALLVTLIKICNTNHIEFDNNILTVISDKPSLFMSLLLVLLIGVPLIVLATIFIQGHLKNIPLKKLPKAILHEKFLTKNKKDFLDSVVSFTALLFIIVAFISIEIKPSKKIYDYVLPETGQTVEMHAYPDSANYDENFAQYYNSETGETIKTKVAISDLKVEPWKSTYTITQEPSKNPKTATNAEAENPESKHDSFTEITVNPGDKIKLFEDGTYEITKVG